MKPRPRCPYCLDDLLPEQYFAEVYEPEDGYLLTTETMHWFWDTYCPEQELRLNPALSPLRAESHADLPPALIVTAEFDPLRDEGEAYGAGVATEIMRCDGLVHDFLATAPLFPSSGAAFAKIAEKLKSALAG